MRMLSKVLTSVGIFSAVIIASCEKEAGEETINQQNEKTAVEFKGKVTKKGFVVTEFYSDKPIDYITTDDTIKLETDLNKYIFTYLKDDIILLKDNDILEIHQRDIKKPQNDSAVLNRNWKIFANKNGVFFNFVDEYYNPRRYKLVEFNDEYFLMYVEWPTDNAKLYSKFTFKEY